MRYKLIFDRTPTSLTNPMRRQYKSVWSGVRRALLKEHGAVCMACGHAPNRANEIEAHEIYSYPENDVIRLELVVLLCRKCHHTVHLERSLFHTKWHAGQEARRSGLKGRRADQAGMDAERQYRTEMAEHYCKVNGVTSETFEEDLRKSGPPDSWRRHARERTPVMDYGPFQPLIDRYLERKEATTRSGRWPSFATTIRRAATQGRERYSDAEYAAMRNFVMTQAKQYRLNPNMMWAVQEQIFEARGWAWFCWLRKTHPKIPSLALQRGLDGTEWDPPADSELCSWPYSRGVNELME
jgi:hypothetical protein